jgi:hypothetical protein
MGFPIFPQFFLPIRTPIDTLLGEGVEERAEDAEWFRS